MSYDEIQDRIASHKYVERDMSMPPKAMTKHEIEVALRRLLWWKKRGLWRTHKRGLKRHTAHGLTLREAASIEHLKANEPL